MFGIPTKLRQTFGTGKSLLPFIFCPIRNNRRPLFQVSASAEARWPHRHGGGYGRHHGCYVTAIVPTFRTVQVERTTTVNKTSRPERKLMAVAYIQKNGYLSVSKYCGFTGLDSKFAEAELDSFTLDRRDPLARTMRGKKVVYILANE